MEGVVFSVHAAAGERPGGRGGRGSNSRCAGAVPGARGLQRAPLAHHDVAPAAIAGLATTRTTA